MLFYWKMILFAVICNKSFVIYHVLFFTGSEVTKLFLCSTQLSMKFQLLIKTKIEINEEFVFFTLSLSDVVFIVLINVKMPTIVGI